MLAGKENIVADTISHLKTVNLYEELNDHEMSKTLESTDDVMENLIFKIHSHSPCTTNISTNLDSFINQQKADKFCKNKVKQLYCHKQTDFKLDDRGVLRKTVHLCHNWISAVVVPKSLINSIIYEYHKCRGHQGIMRMINIIHRYFWWPSIYQHIKTSKLCAQFLANKVNTKPMHLEIPQVLFTGCAVDTIGLLPTTSKGQQVCVDLYVFVNVLFNCSSSEVQNNQRGHYDLH